MTDNSSLSEIDSKRMSIHDIDAEYYGVQRLLLMENAGAGVARFISALFEQSTLINSPPKVAIFCGRGGNGGDGFVVARHLHSWCQVDVFWLGPVNRFKNRSTRQNFQSLMRLIDLPTYELYDSTQVSSLDLSSYDILVDALLGTGLSVGTTKLKEPIKSLILLLNSRPRQEVPLISIDVPSGLTSDGIPATPTIKATHTIALHQAKIGTTLYGGKITVQAIGIPPEVNRYTGPGLFSLLPSRLPHSHKGQNGKILVIGGSNPYHGAPVLAAKAMMALETDLVTLCVPNQIENAVRSLEPGYIVYSYQGIEFSQSALDLSKNLISKVDSILIGPGLGSSTVVQKISSFIT